jgi:hypothetical protein
VLLYLDYQKLGGPHLRVCVAEPIRIRSELGFCRHIGRQHPRQPISRHERLALEGAQPNWEKAAALYQRPTTSSENIMHTACTAFVLKTKGEGRPGDLRECAQYVLQYNHQ